jgi:hypothetical protein
MLDLVSYSDVDTRRFGKRIYRATPREVRDVDALESLARAERVDMIIARCPVGLTQLVHALEARAYGLMDTLVYYAGPTQAFERVTWPHSIREATPGDRDGLASVASDAFANYDGHYHADPRLDPRLATLGYVDWCLNCLGNESHTMWVATENAALVGFIAIRREQNIGEIALNGVASEFQGQGVYNSLLKAAGRALSREGRTEIQSSTHIGNFRPQRAWIRNGMTIVRAAYTFHKWFDL